VQQSQAGWRWGQQPGLPSQSGTRTGTAGACVAVGTTGAAVGVAVGPHAVSNMTAATINEMNRDTFFILFSSREMNDYLGMFLPKDYIIVSRFPDYGKSENLKKN